MSMRKASFHASRKLRYAGIGLVALIVVWALLATIVPALWGAPLLLINPKVRDTLRTQATIFLDGLDASE